MVKDAGKTLAQLLTAVFHVVLAELEIPKGLAVVFRNGKLDDRNPETFYWAGPHKKQVDMQYRRTL